MVTRLAMRIQECLDDLTPSEHVLAAYILEHQLQIVGLTAAELARAAGTSKSTAVRFFRTLGYESYDEVRQQARSELNRRQPGVGAGLGLADLKAGSPQAFLAEEALALSRTLEELSSETLRAVVRRLAMAERVWILALADDAPLGPLTQTLLSSVRGNVELLTDSGTSFFTRLASVSPRDTLFLIALGPRSAEARFAVEQGLSAGADMVVLTNVAQAKPVGADLVMRCHARSDMPDGSVAAAVSLLQFVAQRLASRLGARAAARKALLVNLREEARNR
ncbi:MAG: MurR/RpiR family transcriptional regulator [Qingshengfaniella sp.]